jgi:hypothetical protein
MGTLVVDIIDVARSDDESVHSAWLGGLNGVLSGSSNTQSRLANGIQQAFDQSPYLAGN